MGGYTDGDRGQLNGLGGRQSSAYPLVTIYLREQRSEARSR